LRPGPNAFFHPQYAAFQTLSTIGSADYHGATLTVRQRFKTDIYFDFNYTFSKSIDNGSPIESDAILANVTRNPLNLDLSRSFSDFDIRHNITSNWLVAFPFGRGKRWLNNTPSVVEAVLGGWQTTGYFALDVGLSKSFKMWYGENHRLQFRAEVFNLTNTQRHGAIANFSLNQDPFKDGTAPADFGRYNGSQTPVGETRPGPVMQFALRYTF
jgi:hypothetical protein